MPLEPPHNNPSSRINRLYLFVCVFFNNITYKCHLSFHRQQYQYQYQNPTQKIKQSTAKCKTKTNTHKYRRLIREEGLLCGGSSGTAMVAALQACKKLKKGQRCVVVLPDSIRNYMTKHLSDEWMIERGFLDYSEADEKSDFENWWSNLTIKELEFNSPVTVSETVSVESAIQIMRNTGYDQLPVLKDEQV